jgi:hypothetical protein
MRAQTLHALTRVQIDLQRCRQLFALVSLLYLSPTKKGKMLDMMAKWGEGDAKPVLRMSSDAAL